MILPAAHKQGQPRPQGFSLKKWVGKSPGDELEARVHPLTVTFHMELVNYGFDTRYADITLYVITLRHIPWGGFP